MENIVLNLSIAFFACFPWTLVWHSIGKFKQRHLLRHISAGPRRWIKWLQGLTSSSKKSASRESSHPLRREIDDNEGEKSLHGERREDDVASTWRRVLLVAGAAV
jgi:hypothetical protein